MTVSPAPRLRPTFLGALDGIFLGLGIVFLASLTAARWVRLDVALETWIIRAALGGSLLLFAWGLFRWGQRSWAKLGWSPERTRPLPRPDHPGWLVDSPDPDVRQAAPRATTELCVLVRRIDQAGLPALAARAGRGAGRRMLCGNRRPASRTPRLWQRWCAVCSTLVPPTRTRLPQSMTRAGAGLAPLARASADFFPLASLGCRRPGKRGWEDDPDCAPLLAIWHRRTDHGPF